MTEYVYLVDKHRTIMKQAIIENENDRTLRAMAHHMAPIGRYWEIAPVIDPSTLEIQAASFVVSDLAVLINSPFKLSQTQIDRIVDRATVKYWVTMNKRRD